MAMIMAYNIFFFRFLLLLFFAIVFLFIIFFRFALDTHIPKKKK